MKIILLVLSALILLTQTTFADDLIITDIKIWPFEECVFSTPCEECWTGYATESYKRMKANTDGPHDFAMRYNPIEDQWYCIRCTYKEASDSDDGWLKGCFINSLNNNKVRRTPWKMH